MKRRFWILITGLLVLMFLGILLYLEQTERESFKLKPSLSLTSILVKNIDEETVDFNTSMLLNNPLPIDINTKSVHYKLLVNGKEVMRNNTNKSLKVASLSTTTIELPAKLKLKALQEVLKDMESAGNDSADYALLSTVTLDLPAAGTREFQTNKTWRMPAFQLLQFKLEDLDLSSLKAKNSSVAMKVRVENNNTFPVKMQDATYKVTMEGDFIMAAAIEGITHIPAKSGTEIPVELVIKNKEMLQLLGKSLFKKDESPLVVDFKCKLVSNNEMLKDSYLVMKTVASLKELKSLKDNIKD